MRLGLDGLPSQKLIDAYEDKKTEFTDELNLKITKELKEVESGEPKPKPLTTRQQEIYDFIKHGGNLKGMVKEYYQLMGWDLKTGKPLRSTLRRLGLRKEERDMWG